MQKQALCQRRLYFNLINSVIYTGAMSTEVGRLSSLRSSYTKIRAINALSYLLGMARPARFERATFGFVVRRSIQLSHGRARAMPLSVSVAAVKGRR